MFSLQNKIALVTGAGSGIGAAIAETFARAGAFVFVTDRDEKSGGETAGRIKTQKGQAEFLALDVTNEENCQRGDHSRSPLARRDHFRSSFLRFPYRVAGSSA